MRKVQILGGRAGQAFPYLMEEVARLRAAGTRVLMLVPEQYTLQAERELIAALALPGLMDVEVLSPSRLRRHVREKGGRSRLAPLNDRGRSMALMRALSVCGEELGYYRRVHTLPGLPDKLSTLIADFQRAGVTPSELAAHADTLPPGAPAAKEKDIALIWQTYLTLLEGRFADDAAQQADELQRLIPSGVVQDAAVLVYGFDVLPRPMCELLALCATVARQVTVTLTMDAREAADGRIFLTQRHSAAELMRCLEAAGVPGEVRYLPHRELQHRSAALRHLEAQLFTRREAPFSGDAGGLSLHAAAHPFAEAAHAAQLLHRWHREGMPWGRMAVALADASLEGVVGVTLEASGVPHYLARKDSALRHGLCRFLCGALACVSGGYARRDVLDVARSGFSPLTDAEALQLENYALENGVTRRKWLAPFTRGAQAEAMEPLRQRLTEPLVRLHDALVAARSATASATAVVQLLEDVHAYDRLLAREEQLLARGLQAEAATNRQVWQLVMDLLDQLHALLGESRAPLKEMARYVASGLSGAHLSALPPMPDTVMVGQAGHLMTGEVDALIVMGMQDGVLAASMESLITEEERAALSDGLHRAIGMTRQEQNALRQADFYRTLALPCSKLALSCSTGGQDGAALRPSSLMSDVQAMFPGLKITGGVTAEGGDEPLSPLTALDGLALRLRDMADGRASELDPLWQSALRWLWQSERWHSRMEQVMGSLAARAPSPRLTPDQTRRLFTQDTVSISRLEQFAACPYKHFVDYGLKPVKRRDFAFEADERGSFFHEALHGYATLAASTPGWPDVSEDDVQRMMDQVLSPLEAAWEGGPLREDAMGRQLGGSYLRTVRRAAWLFTRHMRNSRFTLAGTEVAFGVEGGLPPVVLALPDGHRIALRGVIDRIDRFEGDSGVYLRVVDYKSSQRSLDPVRMWYGLQLQLLLYLQAATQSGGDNPAGAFYFTVKDPMVAADTDVKAEAERLIAQALHLKGVVLADAEIISAMDADEPGFSLGKLINTDGSVAKRANALEMADMQALLQHAQQTAAALAQRIREGEVAASPAQVEQWSACEHCEYAAVCGIDPAQEGCEKRELTPMDREELTLRLRGEM